MYKEYCGSVVLEDRFLRSTETNIIDPDYLKKIVIIRLTMYGNSKDIDITTTNLEYLAQIVKQTNRFVLLSTQVDIINKVKKYVWSDRVETEIEKRGLVLVAENTRVAIDNLNRYIEANKDSLQSLFQ